jgi:hypothetical protein
MILKLLDTSCEVTEIDSFLSAGATFQASTPKVLPPYEFSFGPAGNAIGYYTACRSSVPKIVTNAGYTEAVFYFCSGKELRISYNMSFVI